MPKPLEKDINEVAETKLRQLITTYVKAYDANFEEKLPAKERAAMVENVMDIVADPIKIIIDNVVTNEFDHAEEDEDPDDGDEVDPDLEEGSQEGDDVGACDGPQHE